MRFQDRLIPHNKAARKKVSEQELGILFNSSDGHCPHCSVFLVILLLFTTVEPSHWPSGQRVVYKSRNMGSIPSITNLDF